MIWVRRSMGMLVAAGLVFGCAGTREFAQEMGVAVGEGALGGFAEYVDYEHDQWSESWRVSGRGVSGVVSRGAGKPDCSGVDDESILYVGDVLRSPGSFVSTLDGSLDDAAYKSLSGTDFRLRGGAGAIGILQTTAGRYARFVLRWDERPHLHDLTVYDSETGEAVLRFEIPMPLGPHAMVNLDPGEPEGFDLLFGPAPDGDPTLAAGDGAALSFPLASLCGGG